MSLDLRKFLICLLVALTLIASAFAQKVSVGYDKSVDFSKYRSYTWAQPAKPPSRPILYATITGAIDYEMKAKGLVFKETGGDLILIPSGGIDMGINNAAGTPIINSYGGGVPPTLDATMWTGASSPSNLMAPYVPEGTLVLDVVDRRANKVVWNGPVKQKLDLENKKRSLKLVDKAVTKLLKDFPPAKK